MRFRDNSQSNRFEFKYLVNEPRAAAIGDFVRAYLKPDPYADPQRGNSYQRSSLYLDTPDLILTELLARASAYGFSLDDVFEGLLQQEKKTRITFYSQKS